MDPQDAPQPTGQANKFKILYWIAAAAMAIALVMEFRDEPDYLRASSRVALIVALVLLATAKPAETRTKKLVIYLILAVAIGLLLARMVAR